MLALCSDSPLSTWRQASTVAPTTWAAAVCMCSKTGLSSLPRPCSGSSPPSVPMRVTAAISPGVHGGDEVVVGHRGGTTVRPSRTPRASARRIVRSTRIGDIGCDGPKLYSVSVESKTTDAGPEHSTMGANLSRPRRQAEDVPRPTYLNLFKTRLRCSHEAFERVQTGLGGGPVWGPQPLWLPVGPPRRRHRGRGGGGPPRRTVARGSGAAGRDRPPVRRAGRRDHRPRGGAGPDVRRRKPPRPPGCA